MSQIKYSVVIPVYNSQNMLEELTDRVCCVFRNLEVNYEIILVDDFSVDDSWKVMQSLHQKYKNIKIIHLANNFGQHNATLCGFKFSKGEFIITMDDDLQHPPEEIPKLINTIHQGYSVIYGKYAVKQHHWLENFFSQIFQKLMHKCLHIPNDIYLSSFAIYTKEIVESMCNIKNSFPFMFALMIYSTHPSNVTNVEVDHHPRKIGHSNYGLIKYFKYSLNLIVNYSSLPLTAIGIGGFVVSIFSLLFGISIIIQKVLDPNYGVMGWNSLMVAITLLGGGILMSVAIVGEYLRRILAEVSYGQQYLVDKAEL